MTRVVYKVYRPRRILNVHKHVDGGWFWDKYSANPYVGCQYGCEYCYLREEKYCPHETPDLFSHEVKVKENAPDLLRKELKNKPKDIIIPGWYQPVEAKHRLMRGMLSVCLEFGFPVLMVEKSSLLLMDIDVLQEINKEAWCGVLWSFSEHRSGRATRIFEPRTPTPEARFSAMRRVAEAGIYTGAAFMPILPFISDNDENLEGVVRGTKENGGQCVVAGPGVTLSDAQRDRYLHFVKTGYPESLKKYETMYGSSYGPPASYAAEIGRKVRQLCRKYDVADRMPRPTGFFSEDLRVNKRVAERLFYKVYEMELEESSPYRVWAYRKAGWAVDELAVSIRDVCTRQGKEGILRIRGVGEKIADEIVGLLRTS